MKSSLSLRDFQWNTVKAVCDGLNSGKGIYSLADEVGLGKTLVCAETAYQLISNKSRTDQNRSVIYYVAPSIELLHQNLKTICRYLGDQFGNDFIIIPSISRISKIPLDLASGIQPTKKTIHVIGLSPGTSFQMSGAGQLLERSYLAALFGIYRGVDDKEKLAKLFWCLKGKYSDDPNYIYNLKINEYSSLEKLGELIDFRKTPEFNSLLEKLLTFKISNNVSKDQRSLVRDTRIAIVNYLIKQMHPDFVIFDEWHKYKKTCFKNAVLKDFMDELRGSLQTKILFVSATPFSIDYKEENGISKIEDAEDLEGLLQMIWGQNAYHKHYKNLLSKQQAYIDAVTEGLSLGEKLSDSQEDSLKNLRNLYQSELQRYCVRTERPKVDDIGTHALEEVESSLKWGDLNKISLSHLLKNFGPLEGIRSPVTAMWQDGHSFTSFNYPGLKKFKGSIIPGHHWKMERLVELLKSDFSFDDGLHSFINPPLWLSPESPLRNRKHLVFTEFRFVPEEICYELDSAPIGFGRLKNRFKKRSGSILGFFPLKSRKRDRSTSDSDQKDNSSYVWFYPFLVFEFEESQLEEFLRNNRNEIEKIIRSDLDVESMVLAIEELSSSQQYRTRLNYRFKLIDRSNKASAKKRTRDYLRYLFLERGYKNSPGRLIALRIGKLWSDLESECRYENSPHRFNLFEDRALSLSSALLRLFASHDAQALKEKARVKLSKDINKNWNSYLLFAVWYCQKFKLDSTLDEFINLLHENGLHSEAILEEIIASVTLRKGTIGNRYVRSFHDRKIGEGEEDAGDTVSLKSIRAAFNSPFPPYVLASTSVGQEGLDFHRYCKSVIHWSPPASPSALRQREGRVDRYKALQIRIALETLSEKEKQLLDSCDGMCPDFVVMLDGKRLNDIDRGKNVYYLPFTSQAASWRRCLDRMFYNDLLIGAPDPLADERLLLGAMKGLSFEERLVRLKTLQKFAISLKPPMISPRVKKILQNGRE